MKKLTLVLILALAATGAEANRGNRQGNYNANYNNNGYGGYVATAAAVGLVLGAVAVQAARPVCRVIPVLVYVPNAWGQLVAVQQQQTVCN